MNSTTFAAQKQDERMKEILNQYEPITLDEMKNIRLMNRIDTKFVTTLPVLKQLLLLAQEDYYVQETDNERISPYHTVYFDTDDCEMYRMHETGHTNRQKLRVRSYVSAGLSFLEVKTKNNHGRTKKKRVSAEGFDPEKCTLFDVRSSEYADFLQTHLRYDPATLKEQVENRFDRITLVNKGKTERLTIDTNVRFHNFVTEGYRFMDDIVIIELKRDGLMSSPILSKLLDLRIFPHGFSKYCIGSALTNDALRRNRFKPRLHSIERMLGRE